MGEKFLTDSCDGKTLFTGEKKKREHEKKKRGGKNGRRKKTICSKRFLFVNLFWFQSKHGFSSFCDDLIFKNKDEKRFVC
jgi:hypothetical protein